MQHDLPFRRTVPSTHGSETTTIRNRWQRLGILMGGINQTSYPSRDKRPSLSAGEGRDQMSP